MEKDACFLLGRIVKPHGFKGDLSIKLDVDDPAPYQELDALFVDLNGQLVPYFTERMELRGWHARVKLQDVDTEEQARALTGRELYLPLDLLPPLEGDQFYFHEVIGFQVVDKHHGPMGTIVNIVEGAIQGIIQIDHNGQEVLVPITDHIVGAIDRQGKTLHIDAPEGLIELYLNS